jgi:hypothetical protein
LRKSSFRLGQIAGLKISARPSVLVSSLVLWAILTVVGNVLLNLPLGAALAAGFVATLLHWLSSIVHHLGHAWAALRTGHPMVGVRLWGVLGTSLYPRDEPPLPADVHIRRALGGPLASLLLTALAGAIVLALRETSGAAWWVALFFFVENLFVYTLQVLLPLGFNDGGTLLHWWRRRGDR